MPSPYPTDGPLSSLARRLAPLALVTACRRKGARRFRCELGSGAPLLPSSPSSPLRKRSASFANIPTEARESIDV